MYTEKELNNLIADVTTQFTAHLAKAEESFKLAKSEDESDKDESKEPKKEIEHEKEEDKGIKDQHQQDTSKEQDKQPPESKEERVEGDKKENEKPSEDPHGEALDHGYDDEDMQHMHSMYSSMSRPELKAHHDAVRKCMDGMMKSELEDSAKDAQGYRPNGGPAEGEAARDKTPACSDTQAFEKSEKDFSDVSLLKSELEAAKAESEERKRNLDAVSAFLTKFVEKTAPAGKAITSLDIIAKNSESNEKVLQKSEIDAKLMAKAKDLSLTKSDRDAINSYYCGSKNIETVRHLLK
jgi:hypothetical protein